MFTRFYAHNYKCLLNFEIEFGDLNLVVGPNGAGKTALSCAMMAVRDLIGGTEVLNLFGQATRTRWVSLSRTEFALTWWDSGLGKNFEYMVSIEFGGSDRPHIHSESLTCDTLKLYKFEGGTVTLWSDSGQIVTTFPAKSEKSALSYLETGPETNLLGAFVAAMRSIVFIQPNPWQMGSLSESESLAPDYNLSNLSSWLRAVTLDMKLARQVHELLVELFDDYENMSFQDIGASRKIMTLHFGATSDHTVFLLEEMSEGQRCAIALATLIEVARARGLFVILDEADNFVAANLLRILGQHLTAGTYYEQEFQAVVISHQPQIISQLAEIDKSFWMERRDGGHAVARELTDVNTDQLTELMFRGWIDGEAS